MTDYQIKAKEVDELILSNHTSLSELAQTVQKLIDKHGVDAWIQEIEYPYSDGDFYHAVMKNVQETEEEYIERVKKENSKLNAVRASELKLLKELKEKYE